MKLSLTLASLGLCLSSALAERIVQVVIKTENAAPQDYEYTDSCIATDISGGDDRVLSILVSPDNDPQAKCTFYDEPSCQGQKYTLKAGTHNFSRDFYVESFDCTYST